MGVPTAESGLWVVLSLHSCCCLQRPPRLTPTARLRRCRRLYYCPATQPPAIPTSTPPKAFRDPDHPPATATPISKAVCRDPVGQGETLNVRQALHRLAHRGQLTRE